MEIKIDEKNRINVHKDHYALTKPKATKDGIIWEEYNWHSTLEYAIKSLAQRELSKSDRLVDFDGFIEKYHEAISRITNLCVKSN